jgi:uncharacterized protein (UPF0548 family)
MFLARRPSLATIDRFLGESETLPLSYGPIGIVRDENACRNLDEATVAIGHGEADFTRARAALMAWHQFDIGWVETFPRHAPVAVGTVVAVLICHFGFWSLNGCRVLYHLDRSDDVARFGFGYGTLTNHAEAGEELFEVFLDPRTDAVMYRIRATSRPTSHAGASGPADRARTPGPLSASLSRGDEARDGLQGRSRMSIYVEILIRARRCTRSGLIPRRQHCTRPGILASRGSITYRRRMRPSLSDFPVTSSRDVRSVAIRQTAR